MSSKADRWTFHGTNRRNARPGAGTDDCRDFPRGRLHAPPPRGIASVDRRTPAQSALRRHRGWRSAAASPALPVAGLRRRIWCVPPISSRDSDRRRVAYRRDEPGSAAGRSGRSGPPAHRSRSAEALLLNFSLSPAHSHILKSSNPPILKFAEITLYSVPLCCLT